MTSCANCGQPVRECYAVILWGHRHKYEPDGSVSDYCQGWVHWHDAEHECGPPGLIAHVT